MKRLLYILTFLLPTILFGQKIYVDPINGNDVEDGSTYALRVQTLSRLEELMSDDVDTVYLFDTLHIGTLTFDDVDGAYGDHIQILSYNEYGKKTRLTNKKTLSSFSQSGNYWSKTDSDLPDDIYVPVYYDYGMIDFAMPLAFVRINGVKQRISKEPNSDAIAYEATDFDDADDDWIEDDVNTWDDNTWDGALLVLRNERWYDEKVPVTEYSSNVFNFNSGNMSSELVNGVKYYIVNHDTAADTDGEYVVYPATQTLKIYYESDLNSQTVEVSVEDSVVGISNSSYIRFSGIYFEGGNVNTVMIDNSYNIVFDSCNFKDANYAAVFAKSSDTIRFRYDTVLNSNDNGFAFNGWGDEISIENCYFDSIAMEPGMSGHYSDLHNCAVGMFYGSGDYSIMYNRFRYMGKAAWQHSNSVSAPTGNFDFAFNLSQYACQFYGDYGDIHTGALNNGGSSQLIRNNIFYSSGDHYPYIYDDYNDARGIYLDENTDEVYCDSNSIYNHNMPIFLNFGCTADTITNTKIYYFSRDGYSTYANGFWMRDDDDDNSFTNNTIVVDNHGLDSTYFILYNITNGFEANGNDIDYNNYLSPYENIVKPFRIWAVSLDTYTFTDWKSTTSWDGNSTYDNTAYDTTIMYCNWSSTSHVFEFSASSAVDEDGGSLSGSVTVPRYYSAIVRMNSFSSSDEPLYIWEEEAGETRTATYRGISISNASHKGMPTPKVIKYRNIIYE